MKNYDLAIIGTGPAGMSAAIYGSRGELKTIMFGDETKSNLYKSHIISNYFAFPNDPSGPELVTLGLKHAMRFGAEHSKNEIVDLKILENKQFELKDSNQNIYQSKTVIISTGQSYALSGIQHEQELTGKGVSYCVTCDGYFFKNKKVVVVGNGDYAAEEAIQLLSYTTDITILSHGKKFMFNNQWKKQLAENKIKTLETSRLKIIQGKQKVENIKDIQGNVYQTDGVFMAVGTAGAISFAKKLGIETIKNYIKVDSEGKTNIPRLYAAGDCTGSPPQVAISIGSGCNAALSCIKLIRGLKIYIQYN